MSFFVKLNSSPRKAVMAIDLTLTIVFILTTVN